MAPSSHSLTVRGPTADDDPAHTFKVFRAWLIALCCFTILVILGSSSLIIALLNRWREACDKYDDLKKASARLSSINDYLTRRLDTIEPQLDRLRGRAYLSSRTPYRPWVTSRLPPAPLGSPASSHSVSDSAVNPFAAIGDDWSTSGGDVDDDNSIHTTRAQPIVRTVFTDGSSPRPLIMTPGLSDGDSQRAPSPLRESSTDVRQPPDSDDDQPVTAAVRGLVEEQDENFSTFSGVHAVTPGAMGLCLSAETRDSGAQNGKTAAKQAQEDKVEVRHATRASSRFTID